LWHPRAEVRVMRVHGTEILTGKNYNVINDEIARGNIIELISNSWELLKPHLVETKFAKDALFRQRVMYPEDACREALINAIAHRDYSNEGRNIEIKIFNDRMEVTSPVGLLSNLRVKDLKRLDGVHQSRNSLIARVLKEIGYMREMGEGIRRIYHLMKQNDLVEPEIINETNQFTIVLYSESVFSKEDQRYIEAFEFLSPTREEMLLILLGKNGDLLSPQMIHDYLELLDWDNYRRIIENAMTKGIVYNALNEREKTQIASKKGISKRDVKRLKIRTPKECEEGLRELFQVLNNIGKTNKINRDYTSSIRKTLNKDSVYYLSSSAMYVNLLKTLNLIDNSSAPTLILKRIWGDNSKQEDSLPQKQNRTTQIKNSFEDSKNNSKNSSIDVKDIYIENLDYETSKEELIDLFSEYGQVEKIHIPRDYRSKKGRGFAFVQLNNMENSELAIHSLNNTSFRDRIIRLNWSNN